jgi:hypothetical protein
MNIDAELSKTLTEIHSLLVPPRTTYATDLFRFIPWESLCKTNVEIHKMVTDPA